MTKCLKLFCNKIIKKKKKKKRKEKLKKNVCNVYILYFLNWILYESYYYYYCVIVIMLAAVIVLAWNNHNYSFIISSKPLFVPLRLYFCFFSVLLYLMAFGAKITSVIRFFALAIWQILPL